MPDSPSPLRTKLASLVAELRATSQVDSATRAALEETATEIIALLHRASDEPRTGESSLRDRLVELEASHPNVAVVVNRLIDMLAQMGI
ncbi:MAG: DUF4404 family protein [Pirellulaceae bacterium]|nr:DUF4404 family protein [Pirellulaceae bacterium]